MSFRLQKHEELAAAIRRIVREEIGQMLLDLAACDEQGVNRTVHDVRRRLKKVRAALRVARPATGGQGFRRADRAFRDAARPLSELRDAHVAVGTVEQFARRRSAPRPLVACLGDELEARYKQVRSRVLRTTRSLANTARALEAAGAHVEKQKLGRIGASALRRAIQRTYKRGRKAGSQTPTDTNLHTWRKSAKRLWHQLEIVRPVAPAMLKPLEDWAHKLSSLLGDDHDLALLREFVVSQTNGKPSAQARAILRLIDARRRRLQSAARAVAARLFGRRPKALARQIERAWRMWRQ